MVLEQHRTTFPSLQHLPIATAEHTMLEPQPAMLEHWKVTGQAGTVVGSGVEAES
jgi:hypothetical protein